MKTTEATTITVPKGTIVIRPDENVDYDDICDVLARARKQGWAIVAFTPYELGGTDADRVEDVLNERGWDMVGYEDRDEEDEEDED
jgi:hypothetical protein